MQQIYLYYSEHSLFFKLQKKQDILPQKWENGKKKYFPAESGNVDTYAHAGENVELGWFTA